MSHTIITLDDDGVRASQMDGGVNHTLTTRMDLHKYDAVDVMMLMLGLILVIEVMNN